ncbi:SpoIIE family protein phosphatase [Clostridioides mangenotii]|uniref:GAF domain-containing SpoIIE family protein phosphatase n=1 Tax=Metaclostridioides mangenotii TaxID=1540 RepID=UPI00214A7E94|nr:SpoIIE family protein phosphatase [Clostridioides mangenotii]MCR1954596.1 SpoIIE family protein phosphatase [Clostridioides mangenotii]
MNNQSYRMKNLVEITAMVTESTDFYSIKDKIVAKMLEVVHPAKACVNLFYENDHNNAYLVCSSTLEYVPSIFPASDRKGAKIDFNTYSQYIHDAVEQKKIVHVKNIFEDDRAVNEREVAKNEGYLGRIVFPLMIDGKVVGFMTCFLTRDDYLTDEDIDFIASVASLLSLSIEITNKNNNVQSLIDKFRVAISYINDATRKLYQNKSITEFLDNLSKQACNITNSRESLIILDEHDNIQKMMSCYNKDENKTNLYPIKSKILSNESLGGFINDIKSENVVKINSYIYYKLQDKDKIIGCIVCANSKNYTNDDLNILRILASQVAVAMQLYEYNDQEVKHKVLEKELNILNKQQQLIMDKGKMEFNTQKELYYYHRPAKVVGGDFYHAIDLDEKHVAFIVADVMGHGIVSNYVVAMIKGAFKVLCYQYTSTSEILTNLNKILYDEFDKMGVFTTCLVGIIDTEHNIITVSNAGHYSPIIVTKKGEVVKNINCNKGIPIGIMQDASYEENTFSIVNYSMLCMYTDGVLEIKNESKEEYGIERLEAFLKKNHIFNQEEIVENLKVELQEFSSKEYFEDDILVVMLKDI